MKIIKIPFLLTLYHGCFIENGFPLVYLLPHLNKQIVEYCVSLWLRILSTDGEICLNKVGNLTLKFFDLIFYVYLRNDELNDFRFYVAIWEFSFHTMKCAKRNGLKDIGLKDCSNFLLNIDYLSLICGSKEQENTAQP